MEKLEKTLSELEIPYNQHSLDCLIQYMNKILEWNEHVNLTAICDKNEFILKHYIDSVMICAYEPWNDSSRIIDVGTGAGFPGIPLAILHPHKEFVLMDSLGKRIKILKQITDELRISNVELIHARAEELARKEDYRESFDLCVSRAVANLSVLSEYCIPFVKIGGYFSPYKTLSVSEEILQAKKAIKILGGVLEEKKPLQISDVNLEHQILWIKKQSSTAAKYPRKAGTPAKEPLK
ncbi:16S rRNA (guanine(527)-N(7))-methyltransferase RsmG [Sinanaerobacter sp. ZZT-01]|uniref:16S rRNA (guanine(527)-N(7))-methyltransferase RsmG n=1 Tax=Sinanaerobacter sp. ZZT-01 TaxID=3111540 RepID=UPI002D7872FA|nr:16S rRNA (guanine(527)-N(7))-methyltransferase RsmG [Sinanaerobacter sp. ZZT-01]WRR94757.1 16S rRNA (guanine(527)-N(7))-methyltransferase RsmG [Sinanaerobacter sp. ZZT-01]